MAYETSAFGSADGSNVNSTVSNHYGARVIGNTEGVFNTSGHENEAVMNFDGDTLDLPVFLPEGSYVFLVETSFATGAVSTATVGGTDISTAGGIDDDDTVSTLVYPTVIGPVGGELVITGPTAGSVVVHYRHMAA